MPLFYSPENYLMLQSYLHTGQGRIQELKKGGAQVPHLFFRTAASLESKKLMSRGGWGGGDDSVTFVSDRHQPRKRKSQKS